MHFVLHYLRNQWLLKHTDLYYIHYKHSMYKFSCPSVVAKVLPKNPSNFLGSVNILYLTMFQSWRKMPYLMSVIAYSVYLQRLSISGGRGYHSRNSDWLWAERPRGRSLSPRRGKSFLFSISSRIILGSTQVFPRG
jgi:hypothetical protein